MKRGSPTLGASKELIIKSINKQERKDLKTLADDFRLLQRKEVQEIIETVRIMQRDNVQS